MNAAIRAVTRTALSIGWEVFGVQHGYAGLIAGDLDPLGYRDVGGIIQQAGTALGSERCAEFRTPEGRAKAIQVLEARKIDALIVIGGNGSQTGAHALWQDGFPVVGVASTIDNDLCGSDMTIGVDTALNVALEAIDRLKVTAASHHRAFLVEVMGRDCGYLALVTGIAGGAEAVIVPEVDIDPNTLAEELHAAYHRGKTHGLVVVAEGANWNGTRLASYFEEHRTELGFDLRLTILGHVQRGGTPTVADRLLASRLGAAAVDRLKAGESGVLVGIRGGGIATTPLSEIVGKTKPIDPALFELANVLAQ